MNMDLQNNYQELTQSYNNYTRNFGDTLNDLGVNEYKAGRINNAIKCFLKSFYITNNNDALLNLIEVFRSIELYDFAIKFSNLYQKLNPLDFNFYEYPDLLRSEKIIKENNIKNNFHVNSSKVLDLPTIVFLHLSKTGGTTLWDILNLEYSSSKIYPQLKKSEYANFISSVNSSYKFYDVISGHIPFGIHKYLEREVTYFTFLRDPVERIISDYFYVLREKEHHHNELIIKNKMSLAEYVEMSDKGNGQVAALAGCLSNKNLDKTTLHKAKENLNNKMFFVGLTEEFDASILILKNLLGWLIEPYYIKKNVTKFRPQKPDFNKETIKLIKEKNQLDIDLYEYAKQIFKGYKKNYGEKLNEDVKEFRHFNSLLTKII